jgi:hypothetical protein
MEYTSTFTIDLINSDALSLLLDMERMGLIRVTPPEERAPAPESVKTTARSPMRIGFLKGRVSVPADFDTLGQDEITALFAGSP